jgi:hypothetical protein
LNHPQFLDHGFNYKRIVLFGRLFFIWISRFSNYILLNTHIPNIINRIYNLPNFLTIWIFLIQLIFIILFQLRILSSNFL